MKTRSPLNSMLTAPSIGTLGFPPAPPEANQIPVIAVKAMKRRQLLRLTLLASLDRKSVV